LCGGKTSHGLLGQDQESASLHLIGEAYVHGLMEGEAFQEQAKAIEPYSFIQLTLVTYNPLTFTLVI
jgi:hypothetical protein